MRDKHYPAKYGENQFHCPRCNVFASQTWKSLHIDGGDKWIATAFNGSYCSHCRAWSFWFDERLIDPAEGPVEPPHPELPASCVPDYNEARDIVSRSPRGAVALLRLVLQKLMGHLGESGKNINDDIKSLVSKGLPGLVQQALDVCRVVGNNAVHPGELDSNDTPDIAHQLFRMINFIADDRIARPKEIEALYAKLPQAAKDAISKRDG